MFSNHWRAAITSLFLIAVTPCLASAQSASGGNSKPNNGMRNAVERQMMAVQEQMLLSERQLEEDGLKIEKRIEILKKESVSDIAFEDVFRMLYRQKVELTIEMEGLNARLALLKHEVASSTSAVQKADSVTDAQRDLLKRYVANQEEMLERTKSLAAQGLSGRSNVNEAENLLNESKIKLMEFDHKAAQASPAYVQSIFETALALAEKNAKLSAVEKMLLRHIEARDSVAAIDDLKQDRRFERVRIKELQSQLFELRTQQFDF